MDAIAKSRPTTHYPTRARLYLLGVAAMLIAGYLAHSRLLLRQIEAGSLDWRFNVRGERPRHGDVTLVLIDESTLARFGQWPWKDRGIHARVIDQLKSAGASVIVFDVIFSENADSAADAKLADAVARAGNVVLAGFSPGAGGTRDGIPSISSLVEPIEPLARAADVGLAMAAPDPDGSLRHALLLAVNAETGKPIPQLALAAVLRRQGMSVSELSVNPGRSLRIGDLAGVPLNSQGQALVNFAGGTRLFDVAHGGAVPYVNVHDGVLAPGSLSGKIALVGFGAHGLIDVHPNPFSEDFPGPAFNAQVIENILHGEFLSTASTATDLLLLVLVGLLITHISATLRPLSAAGVTAVILAGYVGVALWAFIGGGVVLAIVGPVLSGGLAYAVVTVRRLTSEERSRAHLRRHFASYAPPEVVEQLDSGVVAERMEGIEDEITVLFSDIRGFTHIGSQMEPRRLVAMLNRYFTAMTEVVFDFGGTVDKFIGDGLLVLFNALVKQDDHAKLAVFTALEMQKRVKRLNEEWADEGFPRIRIGVGIHTGSAVVGNVGPRMRMDYTAIGATVSLASRVEGLTKDFGTEIIITRDTLEQLGGLVEVKPLGPTEIRGIDEPVEVFGVLGPAGAEGRVEDGDSDRV